MTTFNRGNVDFEGGTLANNGGDVATVLINPIGVAINNGDNSTIPADTFDLDGDNDTTESLPVDARGTGFARQLLSSVDIGAVEAPVSYTHLTLPTICSV